MSAPDWVVEHKAIGKRVVELVGLPRARGVDFFFVGSAVSGAIAHARQIATAGSTHAPRRKDALKIAEAARALTESVTHYAECWPDSAGTAHVQAVTRRQLLNVLEFAPAEYDVRAAQAEFDAKHKGGFTYFICEGLAPLFKASFGQEPDVKHRPNHDPEYVGEFLHLARFVFAEAGVKHSDDAIYQALRRKNRQNPK